MKKLHKLLRWIIVSLIIQMMILIFFNNIYLVRNKAEVEASKYSETAALQIPPTALGVKVSYDGKYVGYMLNGNMKVLSVESKQEIQKNKTEQVSFFRWLPDRDILIISKINSISTSKNIEVMTIDVLNGDERSYPSIKNLSNKCEVLGIELSPLTNVVYIKVKVDNYKMDIYKYDILDNLKYVMTVDLDTKLKQMNFTDTLIYQVNPSSLFIRNGTNNYVEKITMEKASILIGTDYEDNVYMGELDNDRNVNRILYRKEQGTVKENWKQIKLKNSYSPNNIFISAKGNIYCLKGRNIDIVNKDTEITFSGQCIDILGEYAAIIDNNELIVKKIQF